MSRYIPNNQDFHTFTQFCSEAEYWSAGELNLFMMCVEPDKTAFKELPNGYIFRLCNREELELWMELAVEEPYVRYVSDFYDRFYAPHNDEFFRRCTFVCEPKGKPVSTGFIWKSYGLINTIAWFRTLPEYEGFGLGRALLSRLLSKTTFPVYLHTQPTSIRAIKLYSDFGFKLITNPMVGFRENNLSDCLPILQKVMPRADFNARGTVAADRTLLEAAHSNVAAEF